MALGGWILFYVIEIIMYDCYFLIDYSGAKI